MQHVLVVDAQRRPLMPCRPARARLLLTQGKATVVRRYPFVIQLKAARPDALVHLLRLKIDPGSQTTGLALVTGDRPDPDTSMDRKDAQVQPVPLSPGSVPPCSPGVQRGDVWWAGELAHLCLVNEHGFPRTKAKGPSRVQGFKTGDMVKAVVLSGKPRGTHVGKVAVKARGYFTVAGVPDVPVRCCRLLHHADGYAYTQGRRAGRSSQLGSTQDTDSRVNGVREETNGSRDRITKGGRAVLSLP